MDKRIKKESINMILNKSLSKSELFLKSKWGEWSQKLKGIEDMSAEDVVQFLSDGLFKILIFLGIPYFIFVFIQFLLHF